jgi:hypothetical protein
MGCEGECTVTTKMNSEVDVDHRFIFPVLVVSINMKAIPKSDHQIETERLKYLVCVVGWDVVQGRFIMRT